MISLFPPAGILLGGSEIPNNHLGYIKPCKSLEKTTNLNWWTRDFWTINSELLRQAIEGSSNSFVRSLLERAVTEGVPCKNPAGWGWLGGCVKHANFNLKFEECIPKRSSHDLNVPKHHACLIFYLFNFQGGRYSQVSEKKKLFFNAKRLPFLVWMLGFRGCLCHEGFQAPGSWYR